MKRNIAAMVVGLLILSMAYSTSVAQTEKDKNNGCEEMATIYIRSYDCKRNKLVDIPIGNISKDKAIQLKEKLKALWMDNGLSTVEKTIRQLDLLYNEGVLPKDMPINEIKRFIYSMYHNNKGTNDYTENGVSSAALSTAYALEEGNVINFMSFVVILNLFQSTSFGWLCSKNLTRSYSSRAVNVSGYNLSFFIQHGVCGVVAPFSGLGFLVTIGLLGEHGFFQPTSYFGFIFGFAWLMFAIKWGTPPASIFEVIIGFACLPVL